MSDDVTFQTSVTATPPNATRVATDFIASRHFQWFKLAFGDDGTAYALAYGTPMPIGTLPGGTLQVHGTLQALGTIQPLAGSVHPAAALPGTSHITGTLQPLAGSAHIANSITGTVQTHGTSQVIGTVQAHGTNQALGTFQPLAGSVHLASRLPGTVDVGTIAGTVSVLGTLQPLAGSVHLANTVSGTVQVHGTVPIGTVAGTVSALGTFQPLAGSVHLASNLPGGSINAQGVIAHDSAAAGNPLLFGAFGSSGTQAAVGDGDVVRLWADLNGRLQIRGTIDSMPAISVTTGTIPGGTVQLHGTSEILGTVRALTTVNVTVGTIAEGTINSFTGTAQVLGTIQTLAGSVHLATNLAGGTVVAVGSAVHGAAADTRPLLMSAFGSSGTQGAVDDGDAVRLWADLNGRLQIRGTIDSLPPVTATNLDIRDLTSASDSVTVTGTVQTHGTSQALGTVQPLAGSVHVANTAAVVGSVSAQGYVANGAAAAGNPLLVGAFGSSGTQAAVDDGDSVRLWADLNGRLQVRGTIDSLPSITVGAALPAGDNNIGNVDVVTMPTVTVTGTVQTHGTSQALGTVQPLAGSVHVANTLPGTVATRTAFWSFGSYFGTAITAAATNGTLIAPLGQGTRWRLFDVTVSASAAGTLVLQEAASGSVVYGPLFFAANGGMVHASSLGLRARGTNLGLFCTNSAGTMSVTVNYALETP